MASWESNLDGTLKVDAEPSDSGEITGFGYLSEGEHAIELNVTDTTGKTGSDSVIISVGPPNSAPSCEITAPDGASGQAGDTVTLKPPWPMWMWPPIGSPCVGPATRTET